MTCRTSCQFLARRAASLLILLAVGACGWLAPYRIDIQQGNVVEASQIAQLRAGLTREQVRFVLGTPLITDVFHEDRWDYVYYVDRRSTSEREQGRASLFFAQGGLLERWTADVAPSRVSERKNRVIDITGSGVDDAIKPAASPAENG